MTNPKYMMIDPKIVQPSPWNSNVVSHENEAKLRASIERNGMFKPILIRQTSSAPGTRDLIYQCIGGWHRCEQAAELGYAEIPAMNLGQISDEKAKEISLADNARYGIDDTLKLSQILEELDTQQIEMTMPWTDQDIAALTASVAVNVDDLELDEPEISDEDEDVPAPEKKPERTHQIVRFRLSLDDAAEISKIINETRKEQGFTQEDDLTNAGDALSFLLLNAGVSLGPDDLNLSLLSEEDDV